MCEAINPEGCWLNFRNYYKLKLSEEQSMD